MTKVILTSQVGADGVLKVTVPLKLEDANKTVRVIVEALEETQTPINRPSTRAEWLQFIERTAGSITDPTFERQPQGEFERRDEFP